MFKKKKLPHVIINELVNPVAAITNDAVKASKARTGMMKRTVINNALEPMMTNLQEMTDKMSPEEKQTISAALHYHATDKVDATLRGDWMRNLAWAVSLSAITGICVNACNHAHQTPKAKAPQVSIK